MLTSLWEPFAFPSRQVSPHIRSEIRSTVSSPVKCTALPFGTNKRAQLLMRWLEGTGKEVGVGPDFVHFLANRVWFDVGIRHAQSEQLT